MFGSDMAGSEIQSLIVLTDDVKKVTFYISRKSNLLSVALARERADGSSDLDVFKLTFRGECFFLETAKFGEEPEGKSVGLVKKSILRFMLKKILGKAEYETLNSHKGTFLSRTIEKFVDSCLTQS